MKRWTGLAKLCRIYRIGRTSLRHPQDTKDIIFVCVLTIVSELFITIIIIIFVISSESQALPSACLCCDSQLLVRDPALCRTHQPKISSHSSTRSFPASLLSSTNHQRRFRLKFILGSSCLFCIPATKLLVLGLYQQMLQQCPTPRHTSKQVIHPWSRCKPRSRRPRCRPRYKRRPR